MCIPIKLTPPRRFGTPKLKWVALGYFSWSGVEGQVWGSQNFANAGESRESQCAEESMWSPCEASFQPWWRPGEAERLGCYWQLSRLVLKAPAVNFLFLDLGLLECYPLPHFLLQVHLNGFMLLVPLKIFVFLSHQEKIKRRGRSESNEN